MLSVLVAVLCSLCAALIMSLYVTGRTGTMPLLAAVGSALVYAGIGVNHLLFVWDDAAFWAGSWVILVGLVLSLVALSGVMRIGLFRRRDDE